MHDYHHIRLSCYTWSGFHVKISKMSILERQDECLTMERKDKQENVNLFPYIESESGL